MKRLKVDPLVLLTPTLLIFGLSFLALRLLLPEMPARTWLLALWVVAMALFGGLASNNLHVIPVDTFTLIREITANPAAYGFGRSRSRLFSLL